MMVAKKIIILIISLLLGQISESSNDIKEILRQCNDDDETKTMQLINVQETEEKVVQLTQESHESLPTAKFLDGIIILRPSQVN